MSIPMILRVRDFPFDSLGNIQGPQNAGLYTLHTLHFWGFLSASVDII